MNNNHSCEVNNQPFPTINKLEATMQGNYGDGIIKIKELDKRRGKKKISLNRYDRKNGFTVPIATDNLGFFSITFVQAKVVSLLL